MSPRARERADVHLVDDLPLSGMPRQCGPTSESRRIDNLRRPVGPPAESGRRIGVKASHRPRTIAVARAVSGAGGTPAYTAGSGWSLTACGSLSCSRTTSTAARGRTRRETCTPPLGNTAAPIGSRRLMPWTSSGTAATAESRAAVKDANRVPRQPQKSGYCGRPSVRLM